MLPPSKPPAKKKKKKGETGYGEGPPWQTKNQSRSLPPEKGAREV